MKRILFTLFIFVFSQNIFAQGINFQGVARSANGTILASSNISLRLSIISKSVDATPEYIEIKKVVTNAQGIFSIVIGDAVVGSTTGSFKTLNWADAPKFLKVEMDPSGGTSYISMGITQLQYVPYSFYSLGVAAENVTGVLPVEKGGTGVGSLADLKTALKISNFDSTALSSRIDTKLSKADTSSLSTRIDGINSIISYDTLYNMKFSKSVNTYVSPEVFRILSETGDRNLAIGPNALNSNTTGRFNIGIGYESLSSNIRGHSNVAVGVRSLKSNTTGIFNSSFGFYSLMNNTVGSENTAVGNYSLHNNLTGTQNVAVGASSLSNNTSGSHNIAVGSKSMATNSTGSFNSAFGYGSLVFNTTGSNNSSYGNSSLILNSTGYSNTAIGSNTLQNNTIGHNNTAIGDSSLFSNTTGSYNTAIGDFSGLTNTTGSNNLLIGKSSDVSIGSLSNATAIGNSAIVSASNTIQLGNSSITDVKTSGNITAAGYKVPGGLSTQYLRADGTVTTSVTAGVPYTGANQSVDLGAYDLKVNGLTIGIGGGTTTNTTNTAVGNGTLANNTSGFSNTAMGLNSMKSNTVGFSNVAYGIYSMYSNTTGIFNTAIGDSSLYSNTTGYANVGVGFQSLALNTTSIANVAVGNYALKNNQTGSYNTALGGNALNLNQTGASNIAIGNASLFSNLSGNTNVAVGAFVLNQNTTGYSNVALGASSLKNNQTGSNNVALGDSTLFKSTLINGTTAIGSKALYNNTSGTSNTALGYQSLTSNTTGSSNTAIGYSAMSSSSTYSNSTALGYNAQVTASNQIQLGDANVTDVKTSGVITTSGIGIGTKSNTTAALEINSTSQGFLPPRMTGVQRDAISSPAQGLIIYCSDCGGNGGQPQYYNGNSWRNMLGDIALDYPVVGRTMLGGVVAYILQPSDLGYISGETHGIIATVSDLVTQAPWGCSATLILGADGIVIGSGNQNTLDIVAQCTESSIAAKLCYDLVEGGYSDWYLPSKDELNKLFLNKEAIGGFTTYTYTTSSEFNNEGAWSQWFYNGSQANYPKIAGQRIRAIRVF